MKAFGGILVVVGIILLVVLPAAGIVAILLGIILFGFGFVVGYFRNVKKGASDNVALYGKEQDLFGEVHSIELSEHERKIGVFKFLNLSIEKGSAYFGVFLLTSKRLVFRSLPTTQFGRSQGGLNVTIFIDRLKNLSARDRVIAFLHDGTKYEISRGIIKRIGGGSIEELASKIRSQLNANRDFAYFGSIADVESQDSISSPPGTDQDEIGEVKSQDLISSPPVIGQKARSVEQKVGLLGRMPTIVFLLVCVAFTALVGFVFLATAAFSAVILGLSSDSSLPVAFAAVLAGLVLPSWLLFRIRKRQKLGL